MTEAEKEIIHYSIDVETYSDEHVEAIIDLAMKVLNERRPRPQMFAVMHIGDFAALTIHKESAVIAAFGLPVSFDVLIPALQRLNAGIPVRIGDKVIIPHPIAITGD